MTKLSDLGPPILAKRHGDEPADERPNFYPCPTCGQLVDMRDARQVFYHERPGHEPLEPEDGDNIIKFPDRRRS
ncbi:hypothetical protein A9K65_013960 [Mesorhizobium sp. WSM1497]|uniref:hypothetical protein n=1 Tax=Mesorhizobium sp. WSM1497 TaxID=278153 RepID=UPI0007ED8156|nr:hypothetical protein [Mesorhizobium sp. WSM1497]ARP64360.1 hypothetical protein A9K65_013960 [Mesorhizobium sp. WSM1497]